MAQRRVLRDIKFFTFGTSKFNDYQDCRNRKYNNHRFNTSTQQLNSVSIEIQKCIREHFAGINRQNHITRSTVDRTLVEQQQLSQESEINWND